MDDNKKQIIITFNDDSTIDVDISFDDSDLYSLAELILYSKVDLLDNLDNILKEKLSVEKYSELVKHVKELSKIYQESNDYHVSEKLINTDFIHPLSVLGVVNEKNNLD